MAGFKTHITASGILGIGYGGIAFGFYDVPLSTSILAGGLCGVSGMLPDIDSGPGVPLRESMAFAAAVVPMMMIDRLRQFGMPPEFIVLTGAGIYLTIRFMLAAMLRRYTVHRGMFHSIPAAIIFGEIAFLLASGDLDMRIYKAGGVVAGYMSHLILDELYSLEWYRGRLRLKKSFGTAVKLISRNWLSNVSTYLKLAMFTVLVFKEPTWMQQFNDQHIEPKVEQAATEVIDQYMR